MLTVKTQIKQSRIAGIGLFAAQFIPKGTIVWTYKEKLDALFTKEEIEQFSFASQEQFYNYAYLDKTYGQYLLCGDDGRFFNHSPVPNCDDSEKNVTMALQDINSGDELTVDYTTFCDDIENHQGLWLSIVSV